jgi:hypothetical protein
MLLLITFPRSPEETVGALAILGLIVATVFAFFRRVFACPRTPDPRGDDVEQAVEGEEAVPVCPHCLTPQQHNGWFCPEWLHFGPIQQLSAHCLHLLHRGCSQGGRSTAQPVDSFVGDGLCFDRLCLLLDTRPDILPVSVHTPGKDH